MVAKHQRDGMGQLLVYPLRGRCPKQHYAMCETPRLDTYSAPSGGAQTSHSHCSPLFDGRYAAASPASPVNPRRPLARTSPKLASPLRLHIANPRSGARAGVGAGVAAEARSQEHHSIPVGQLILVPDDPGVLFNFR
jgi:hypothetical protein